MAPSADMKRLINILDVCLVLAAAWFVLPLLITGYELELPLPFGNHITAGLSQRNLLIFFIALWVRLHLRCGIRRGMANPVHQRSFAFP